jgi:hypothetical protein
MKNSIIYIITLFFCSISAFCQDSLEDKLIKENQSIFGNLNNIMVFYGNEPAWESDELPDIELIKQKIQNRIPSLNILNNGVESSDAQLLFDLSINKISSHNESCGRLSYRLLRRVNIVNSINESKPNAIVWDDSFEYYYGGTEKNERMKNFEFLIDSLLDRFAVQYYKYNNAK